MPDFVRCDFTDTSGTALTSHATDGYGDSWTEHPNFATGDILISDANRARPNTTSPSHDYASGAAPAADMEVEAVIRVVTVPATTLIGVTARLTTSASTYYAAVYAQGSAGWQIYRVSAGASLQVGSTYTHTPSAGSDYTIRLVCRGSSIRMFLDGVERISGTNSDITGNTLVGLIAQNIAATNSTGAHWDTFRAWSPPIPPVPIFPNAVHRR